jgi:hypothetical protein
MLEFKCIVSVKVEVCNLESSVALLLCVAKCKCSQRENRLMVVTVYFGVSLDSWKTKGQHAVQRERALSFLYCVR